VSSQYFNPLTAYNSNGTAFGTTLEYSGLSLSDVCLVKYDTNGFVQWVTRVAGTGDDLSTCITTDSSGIYISGQYTSNPLTAYNRDGSAFVTKLSRAGFYDAFIVKYNTNGFVQWVTRVAGTGYENVLGITTDSTGIYVVGLYISDPLTAYNSDESAFVTKLSNANPGTSDAFIVKYNTNGFVQWVTRVAGAGAGGDYATSITMDSSGFYVSGQYTSDPLTAYNSDGSPFVTTLSNAGSTDAFIVKYNTDGFVQWVTRVADTGGDSATSITMDSSGFYVSGQYTSNPLRAYNSDGTAFGTILSNTGSTDAFIVKYNTNGFVQWVTRVAGAGTGVDSATSITTDSSGMYVTGRYTSNPLRAYNSDGTAFGTILSHAGSGDAFIVKYNTNGFVQWVTRVAGTGDENVGGITTDSSGMYVTGRYTSNPLTAYNSDGTDFKTKLIKSATSTTDGFIVKYI
jgi:hypothetical protein